MGLFFIYIYTKFQGYKTTLKCLSVPLKAPSSLMGMNLDVAIKGEHFCYV